MSTDAPVKARASEPSVPMLERARAFWAAFVRRCPRGRAMLVLLLLVVALNGLTVARSSSVSPIDETGWINQLVKGARFEVVTPGELMPQESVRELCSRGSQLFVWKPCPARGPVDGSDYVFKGVDISVHTPFYFLVTGPVAAVLRATPVDLPPDDSLVTWGRLLGSAWALLGFYLTLRAGELLGIKRRYVVLALGFMIATPALLHASTIVNPDQTALPSGAAVLLAGLSWERRGRGLWLVALAALVGAAFDPTNAVAILLVLLYLGIRAAQRRREPEEGAPTLAATAATIGLVLVAVYLANKGWDRLDDWLRESGVIEPSSRLRDIGYNPVQEVVSQVKPTVGLAFGGNTPFTMFPPFDGWIPTPMRSPYFTAFVGLAKLVAIGALGVTVLGSRLRGKIGALGIATVVTLLVSPTLIVLHDWYETGHYLEPAARYGLGAIPAIALLVAVASERARPARIAVGLVGAALYVSAAVSLIF